MAGIGRGFGGEGIGGDGRGPLGGGAHNDRRLQAEAGMQLGLQQPFQRLARVAVGAEHQVAALQQRARLGQPKPGRQGPQVGHGYSLAPPDIDAAQQGDVDRHGGRVAQGRGVGEGAVRAAVLPLTA